MANILGEAQGDRKERFLSGAKAKEGLARKPLWEEESCVEERAKLEIVAMDVDGGDKAACRVFFCGEVDDVIVAIVDQ